MLTDIDLKTSVLAELNCDPGVTAAHIGVTADDGVVCLTGHVESDGEGHAADLAARRVKGVKAVVQGIDVRLPFDHPGADADIARAALDRLAWHATDPDYGVRVKVEKGRLTLTGQVGWHFQKDAVQTELLRLQGVVGLDNDITIKPKVSAEGGIVHLSGTDHLPHERSLAAVTAWAAPGVIEVDHQITIA